MSYGVTVFDVMIATPSDVHAERAVIREVIHEWNAVHSKPMHMVLMPVGWDTHSAPAMGERPQGIINRQILRDCDLLVAVFWTRLGTETGTAPSGTVEEIQEHLRAGKPAMLYFSNTPVKPDSVDSGQYEALCAFKQECKSKGLIDEFSSAEEFRNKFTRQLQAVVRESLQPHVPGTTANGRQPRLPSGLSEDALGLLVHAADSDGVIIITRTRKGKGIQAGGKNHCREESQREYARWESVLRELVEAGLVDSKENDIFQLTNRGYQVADRS
ncbi:MAG: hypothetical protein BWX88_02344 [Planctomycetes bacterium ADurb.Bin126]|nr:MAG: hypothetical protein BWX88_02344 [Planctomycetes bacterium ADurb.Bin126]HOD84511.1 DUF4062 domain-containing protein [Phycisphaerae bacterium]HQL75523.1 DUF4062 domain-containing protein [Phycisphaerae bacterium]